MEMEEQLGYEFQPSTTIPAIYSETFFGRGGGGGGGGLKIDYLTLMHFNFEWLKVMGQSRKYFWIK